MTSPILRIARRSRRTRRTRPPGVAGSALRNSTPRSTVSTRKTSLGSSPGPANATRGPDQLRPTVLTPSADRHSHLRRKSALAILALLDRRRPLDEAAPLAGQVGGFV